MISNASTFNLCGNRFWLLPERAIYWKKKETLFIADLHIGKSAHFRKHGIAVPKQVGRSNLNRLEQLIEDIKPEHLIILGDLFHSDINKEWQQFIDWRKRYRQLQISLVVGNHDILKVERYHTGLINIFKKMKLEPFLLVHDKSNYSSADEQGLYILSGHIHPAAKLNGKGRQAMKFPCFYFGQQYGILPAFGTFTGTHIISPTEKDKVFIVVEDKVFSVN
ncbi:ligase-associated DNA damage response endonuclease PdeM [Fodinibius halophilus]|uniref:Ligase-associated DNA damage response endonuclease PdeM n=1 Tax=Fodinibius halophilus TaxID=1736908 RepID=A0A6M1SWX6_9BACT|nr:ligase-associated DNA damage response endonuclease PdeM [Fodinibius halophilus]NGP88378.1 ligase-associated DNA damage response endonuclease PdeM [Fodinibius halophilus]